MLTYRTGIAGGQAAAAAMADHLLQQTLPASQLSMAAYYLGKAAETAEAIALGMGSVPLVRDDISPELAKALALQPGALVRPQELANILSGLSAEGGTLPGQQRDVRTYKDANGTERYRITYTDFTFSVPKAVSVAWMAAETDAERNSIVLACRTANDKLMRYIEREIGVAGFGHGHRAGQERGAMAWISVVHFTSRPTLAITRPDPVTGVVDTELVDVMRDGLMPGDPQIHFHNVTPNLLHTDSGRFVSINRELLAGRIHEFGAVGQAFLTAELEAIGIATALDERTQLLTLPVIPEHVCREFSKRTEQAEEAARGIARENGLEWDALDADRKVALLKGRALAGRQGKGDDLGDAIAWRRQIERLGWEHRTAVTKGKPAPQPAEGRREHALGVGRDVFAPVLAKRAVVEKGDIRLAAARGLIAAGGITDATEVDAVTRAMARRGVRQDGRDTRLLWRDIGQGRVKITTELHRDQELEVIRLARAAAVDRSRALTSAQIGAAVKASGIDFTSPHGRRQLAIIETCAAAGALGVFIGAAGVGKTKGILPPLVQAWQAQGRDVWGTAQAWRQAGALHETGIAPLHCRALQPLLDGMATDRTKLTANSVVVLDELSQVGTRQLLQLLRHQARDGFQLVLTGGERQCQSIEAGPVVELLRKALGAEAIPEILTTIRQHSDREKEIACLFMKGEERSAQQAIAMLREDGHAELVPGGYHAAVERVAALYIERTDANRHDPDYTVTISAPTNADALAIGRSIRDRLQASGDVARAELPVTATDGRGNLFGFAVAAGDRVRLYARTRGLFTDAHGRRKSAHIGDNGSILRVVEVVRDPNSGGLLLETAAGKSGFVSWAALRDESTGRLKLALGYCLTIDSAQGITSDEHISAMPSGSAAVQAFKAYSQGSRHRVSHTLIGSHGAELREATNRRPQGVTEAVTLDACWANVARNLARAPMKELATDMLGELQEQGRHVVKGLQIVLRAQEACRAAGRAVSRLRSRSEAGAVLQAVGQVAAKLEATISRRAPALRAAGAAAAQAAAPARLVARQSPPAAVAREHARHAVQGQKPGHKHEHRGPRMRM